MDAMTARIIILALSMGMDTAYKIIEEMSRQEKAMTPDELDQFIADLEDREDIAVQKINDLIS